MSRNNITALRSYTPNFRSDYLKKRLNTSIGDYGKEASEAITIQVETPISKIISMYHNCLITSFPALLIFI